MLLVHILVIAAAALRQRSGGVEGPHQDYRKHQGKNLKRNETQNVSKNQVWVRTDLTGEDGQCWWGKF